MKWSQGFILGTEVGTLDSNSYLGSYIISVTTWSGTMISFLIQR